MQNDETKSAGELRGCKYVISASRNAETNRLEGGC